MHMSQLSYNEGLSPKEYLQSNVIDLDYILRQPTLYYPGAGEDYGPFKVFTEYSNISTVIYCDYHGGYGERILKDELLKSYEFISEKRIGPDILGMSSWEDFWPVEPESLKWGHPENASAMLFEMRLKSDRRVINFIYLCTEAIQTYKILFSNKKISPTVVVIQDHGLGCGWTCFGGKSSKLYKIAKPALPRFLYSENEPEWQGYERVSCIGEPEGPCNRKRALYARKINRDGQINSQRR